jgi:cellulose biosynthesis protein BcsQ
MKVITCFSYKGGAGRTTAAANIAAALASMTENVGSIRAPLQRKVGIIDLDVFSAGTHRVFEITNREIDEFEPTIQDYLRDQKAPRTYIEEGGISLSHPYMQSFMARGAVNNCHPGFTLFPARPDPEARFIVQKQHENVLVELLMELESSEQGFDYVILDGESGIRQMADIALRLSDMVLMFFRLTWQHIEGTLNTAESFLKKTHYKDFYLIPTCVPILEDEEKNQRGIYREGAPGLAELTELTTRVPRDSELNDFAARHPEGAGYFWADVAGAANRLCVHDSLYLKGEERVIVFDSLAVEDQAAQDFYEIAAAIDRLQDPSQ